MNGDQCYIRSIIKFPPSSNKFQGSHRLLRDQSAGSPQIQGSLVSMEGDRYSKQEDFKADTNQDNPTEKFCLAFQPDAAPGTDIDPGPAEQRSS